MCLRNQSVQFKNNPWITPGLIASIKHFHDLYKAWAKSRKVLCNEGEKDSREGSCLCLVCSEKRFRYRIYSDYRRVLKKARDNAKHKFYHGKFKENEGNLKKTWEIINKICGKKRQEMKPMFIIDNVKITNRRIIANEFNNYFVSLASNLNIANTELGEVRIEPIPSILDYLQNSNLSSIYLNDSSPEEIEKIIAELQNGKAGDIPVHVILSYLINYNMGNGKFPDVLKVGKISPIYKITRKLLTSFYSSNFWQNL